tara:strand:+ start:297 stop:536 length:240 start_codon:yes stop_codon:yes gene_type:complete
MAWANLACIFGFSLFVPRARSHICFMRVRLRARVCVMYVLGALSVTHTSAASARRAVIERDPGACAQRMRFCATMMRLH